MTNFIEAVKSKSPADIKTNIKIAKAPPKLKISLSQSKSRLKRKQK